ncbi:MAG TPA: hypothetical protein VFE62_19470 [Gemmataceae bacterium]|nr:hypothetical protein [Gemmataceae bacterium]
MRHIGTLVIVACMLGTTSVVRAQGGIGGVGGSGGVPSGRGYTGSMHGFTGTCGLSIMGMSGMGGMGGMQGLIGMGGCCGGMFTGYQCNPYGFCNFGGCGGGFGFNWMPTQSYSSWSPSPAKTYYYRTLTVHTPPPNEAVLEFVLVYHPDRPKYFYYYDPVDKKFLGRYTIGAKPEQCFSLLSWNSRKASLKEIGDPGMALAGPMPDFKHIIRPRPGTKLEPALQNLKLMRPPESIPDWLLGLPAEEPTLKKK